MKITFKRITQFILAFLLIGTLMMSPMVIDTKAETVVTTTEDLMDAVNNAAEGDRIVLSPSFNAKSVNLTTPAVNVTIDGQNLVYATGQINISGSGSGSITIKNLKFLAQSSQAIYVASSALTVLDNVYIEGRSGYADGSALGIGGSAQLTIKNSTFINNTNSASGYSGTVGAKFFGGTLVVENNIFEANRNLVAGSVVGGEGGALWFSNPSASANITIKNNYFKGNEAVAGGSSNLADGGAIAFFNILNGIKINIEGNTFYQNIAGDDAGAVLIQNNEAISSGVVFKNNVFYENVAQGRGDSSVSGGAVQLYANGIGKTFTAEFTNNSFVGNTSSSRNGGAFAGTGSWTSAKGNFTNNIFAGNTSNNPVYNGTYGTGNINSGGNIGYDNGTASTVTVADVYGDYDLELSTVNSTIKIGYSDTGSQTLLPTLYIKPAGLADNAAGASALTNDLLGYDRSTITSDAGASEIGYVLFDANGGSFANETVNKTYNGSVYQVFEDKTLPTDPDVLIQIYGVSYLGGTVSKPTSPVKDNSTFLGYSLTSTGSVLSASDLTDILNDVTEGITLFAIYSDVQDTYNVTYVGNGHTGGTVPVDTTDYEAGDTVDIPTSEPTKSGFTFEGWTDGTTIYQPGNSFTMPASDVTLTAVWEAIVVPVTYKVIYDGNGHTGGTVPVDTTNYEAGDIVAVSASVPTKSGSTFKGWTDGTKTYQAGDTFVMPANNVSLTAIWEAIVVPVSYSVTYAGNGHTGGEVPVDTNRYTSGFNVTVLEGTPTRTDYTFKGWTDGTTTYQAGDTFVMPAGNVTLTAVWEAINRPTLPNTGIGINYGSVSIIAMGGVLLVAALIAKRKEQA